MPDAIVGVIALTVIALIHSAPLLWRDTCEWRGFHGVRGSSGGIDRS